MKTNWKYSILAWILVASLGSQGLIAPWAFSQDASTNASDASSDEADAPLSGFGTLPQQFQEYLNLYLALMATSQDDPRQNEPGFKRDLEAKTAGLVQRIAALKNGQTTLGKLLYFGQEGMAADLARSDTQTYNQILALLMLTFMSRPETREAITKLMAALASTMDSELKKQDERDLWVDMISWSVWIMTIVGAGRAGFKKWNSTMATQEQEYISKFWRQSDEQIRKVQRISSVRARIVEGEGSPNVWTASEPKPVLQEVTVQDSNGKQLKLQVLAAPGTSETRNLQAAWPEWEPRSAVSTVRPSDAALENALIQTRAEALGKENGRTLGNRAKLLTAQLWKTAKDDMRLNKKMYVGSAAAGTLLATLYHANLESVPRKVDPTLALQFTQELVVHDLEVRMLDLGADMLDHGAFDPKFDKKAHADQVESWQAELEAIDIETLYFSADNKNVKSINGQFMKGNRRISPVLQQVLASRNQLSGFQAKFSGREKDLDAFVQSSRELQDMKNRMAERLTLAIARTYDIHVAHLDDLSLMEKKPTVGVEPSRQSSALSASTPKGPIDMGAVNSVSQVSIDMDRISMAKDRIRHYIEAGRVNLQPVELAVSDLKQRLSELSGSKPSAAQPALDNSSSSN